MRHQTYGKWRAKMLIQGRGEARIERPRREESPLEVTTNRADLLRSRKCGRIIAGKTIKGARRFADRALDSCCCFGSLVAGVMGVQASSLRKAYD